MAAPPLPAETGLRHGLTGTLRLGVIPAAMPMISFLTARFSAAHPAAKIAIQSITSRAIQRGLDAFEIDGGMSYLDNEPLENVRKPTVRAAGPDAIERPARW